MYLTGLSISISEYFKTLYNSYQKMASIVTNIFVKDVNWNSFLSNILANCYLLFTLYSTASFVNKSVTHYSKCNHIKTKINSINNWWSH